MRRTLIAAIGFATLAGATAAGPLERSRVAADADWVVHVNVERLAGSALMAARGKTSDCDLDGDLARLRDKFGLDPFRDIKDVTLYGWSDSPHKGVLVASATPAVDGLMAVLGEEPGVERVAEEGLGDMLRWRQQGEWIYWCARPEQSGAGRTVLVASDSQKLTRAAEIVSGALPSLASTESPLGASPGAGSFLFIEVGRLPAEISDPAVARMLARVAGGRLDLGERDGTLELRASITGKRAEDARVLQQAAHGFVAMGMFAAAGKPDGEEIVELLRRVTIKAEGSRVELAASVSVADLLKQPEDASQDTPAGIPQGVGEAEGDSPSESEPAAGTDGEEGR